MTETPQQSAPARGMLPGMAAIAMFLLVVSMITGFQIMHLGGISAGARYGILIVCTILVLGVFGLLRLRRWGWALVSAGCVFGAGANFYAFHRAHTGQYLVQGLFLLLFFLYLSRTDVRDRVH